MSARLAQKNLQAAGAVANYVPWAISGNVVMTSGNLPWRDGKLAYVGRIGRELTGEDGYGSCQLSCLNAIAQIRQAVGELSKVTRIIRLEGTLWVDESFKEHPKCLNGASDLMVQVFGDRGRHARTTVGVAELPMDAAVEVEAMLEFEC
jgi:enamine deaminase RidA (YjgF/YER057c/UK114 family)